LLRSFFFLFTAVCFLHHRRIINTRHVAVKPSPMLNFSCDLSARINLGEPHLLVQSRIRRRENSLQLRTLLRIWPVPRIFAYRGEETILRSVQLLQQAPSSLCHCQDLFLRSNFLPLVPAAHHTTLPIALAFGIRGGAATATSSAPKNTRNVREQWLLQDGAYSGHVGFELAQLVMKWKYNSVYERI
jgi:hypothetical protein